MDKSVRDELRTAVIAARDILETDFREQLEGAYGIRADGRMTPLESLTHLSFAGREKRKAIVSAIQHGQGGGASLRDARLGLPPDFNDGVIINMAPLHTLTPWKEAAKMWDELTRGNYGWSIMSQRLRERGLVKGAGD